MSRVYFNKYFSFSEPGLLKLCGVSHLSMLLGRFSVITRHVKCGSCTCFHNPLQSILDITMWLWSLSSEELVRLNKTCMFQFTWAWISCKVGFLFSILFFYCHQASYTLLLVYIINKIYLYYKINLWNLYVFFVENKANILSKVAVFLVCLFCLVGWSIWILGISQNICEY